MQLQEHFWRLSFYKTLLFSPQFVVLKAFSSININIDNPLKISVAVFKYVQLCNWLQASRYTLNAFIHIPAAQITYLLFVKITLHTHMARNTLKNMLACTLAHLHKCLTWQGLFGPGLTHVVCQLLCQFRPSQTIRVRLICPVPVLSNPDGSLRTKTGVFAFSMFFHGPPPKQNKHSFWEEYFYSLF